MIEKSHILSEIRRTADENGGVPLGIDRFFAATGIKYTEWQGRYWPRWNDALAEAGFAPNRFQGAYDDDFLLDQLVSLAIELGHFPVIPEIQMKSRTEAGFPNIKTFQRRGRKRELAAKVVEYCKRQGNLESVIAMCESLSFPAERQDRRSLGEAGEFGYVYLLKSGRFYKIDRTNVLGRRERELAIQLPEKAWVVHRIKTDDPVGIEKYWHERFYDRRKNGEWFELSARDTAAFKRRKFM